MRQEKLERGITVTDLHTEYHFYEEHRHRDDLYQTLFEQKDGKIRPPGTGLPLQKIVQDDNIFEALTGKEVTADRFFYMYLRVQL